MKNFRKIQLLVLLTMSAIVLNASENKVKDDNIIDQQANVKKQIQNPGQKSNTEQTNASLSDSNIKNKLEIAKKDGKAVIIVVTEPGTAGIDKAISIAKNAKAQSENAIVLEMNRKDTENSELVKEWRLSTAPVPLILVVSSKGFLTGGLPLAQASAKKIAAIVPSPKLELVYQAIRDKKNSIIVFTKKSFTDRDKVVKNAKKAVTLLNNAAVFIEVDMNDSKETSFMNQLRIDKNKASKSVTIVINKQGQVAGTSTTIPDPNKLTKAAKTPVKSGCGPGCGPASCGQ